MDTQVLEALDATARGALYLSKTIALTKSRNEMQNAAAAMFNRQAWDILQAMDSFHMSEAQGDDTERQVAAITAAIMLALKRRLNEDAKLFTDAYLGAISASLTEGWLSRHGIQVRPDDVKASEWVSEHGAEMVTGVNEWTRTQLRSLLLDGLQSGKSISEITESIMSRFADMTGYRAETIALTETSKAMSYGTLEQGRIMERAGLDVVKEWLLHPLHPHVDECDENAQMGPVALDTVYTPDVMAPPAHPRCMCFLEVYPDGEVPDNLQILGQIMVIPPADRTRRGNDNA
jgi:hypothetical protein